MFERTFFQHVNSETAFVRTSPTKGADRIYYFVRWHDVWAPQPGALTEHAIEYAKMMLDGTVISRRIDENQTQLSDFTYEDSDRTAVQAAA